MGGGTANTCDSTTPIWTSSVLETGPTIPIATTVGPDGTVHALINAFIEGQQEVIALT
jgi:hypothetical protein